MLPTRSIPIYGDDPEDWHRFLYKASTGSIKAADTLNYANMAYMVAFTGDPSAPETMHLGDYNSLIRERFPKACPISSIHHFHDIAMDHGWIPSGYRVSEAPIRDPGNYVALWGRTPVRESELINDAMLNCLASWSPDHYIKCIDNHRVDYDSRIVATGMLYLSVTWPGTEQSDPPNSPVDREF
jgi:hypothetical protein